MKVVVKWNVKVGIVPKYYEGQVIDVSEAEFLQANRDSPGCLVAVDGDEAPVSPAAPVDRMDRGAMQTRAPQGEAMHSGNMPGISRAEPAPAAPQPAPAENAAPTADDPSDSEGDVGATDAARALAEENGLDIGTVTGTGKGGKVTVGDVRAALE